jgi:hypothetical protein
MPVIPFMPLIAQGAGMLGGAIAGKKATASAQQRSPEETAALTGATGAANTLGQTGSSLLSQGRGYLQQPAGYYQSLLSGNRAAMSNATAAPRAQLQEGYRGAQSGLATSGIRGAAKDQLAGNLQRQGASQIAGLTTGVQPAAAGALAGLSGNLLQAGAPMLGQSGTIFGNLLGQGANNRQYARGEGQQTGAAIGNLVAGAGPLLQGAFGGDNSGTQTPSFSKPGPQLPIGNPNLGNQFTGWAQ